GGRADERFFGEGEEVDPLCGGLHDAGLDLVERGGLVVIDGGEIHHTDVERVVLSCHCLPPKWLCDGQCNQTAIISPGGGCGVKPKGRYSSRRSGYPMTTH